MTLLLPLAAVIISACADGGGQRSTPITGPSALAPSGASATMGDGSSTGMWGSATVAATAVADLSNSHPFGRPSPVQSIQSQPPGGDVLFDGTSPRAVAAERPATGALAGIPSLFASVDRERRTVTLQWARGPGDDPLSWRLYYDTPIGLSGFFDFPLGQTSITAGLPFLGLYTTHICAYNGGPYETGCARSSTVPFILTSNAPNPPVRFRGSATGSTVNLSWEEPEFGGGPVTTYVLYYAGAPLPPLGNVRSFSHAGVPPGRYLLALLARNASGDSAAVSTEVTVTGGSTFGNYTGNYSGIGTYSRSNGCTWTPTYSGAITVILTQATSGLVGSIRVTGTENVPTGTSSTPGLSCLSSRYTYEDNRPVIISGVNIARDGLEMQASTGTFNGNLSGNTIAGTLNLRYRNGTGSISMIVPLTKTSDER